MPFENKTIKDLISSLKEPTEALEMRAKFMMDDFKDYGMKVLEDFKEYAPKNIQGASLEVPNYEGIRVNVKTDDIDGWILIRISLHDPVMPINIETDKAGCLEKLKAEVMKFLEGYDKLSL